MRRDVFLRYVDELEAQVVYAVTSIEGLSSVHLAKLLPFRCVDDVRHPQTTQVILVLCCTLIADKYTRVDLVAVNAVRVAIRRRGFPPVALGQQGDSGQGLELWLHLDQDLVEPPHDTAVVAAQQSHGRQNFFGMMAAVPPGSARGAKQGSSLWSGAVLGSIEQQIGMLILLLHERRSDKIADFVSVGVVLLPCTAPSVLL